MRVVFDTNILVLSFKGDPAAAILKAALTGLPEERLIFYYSEDTFREYRTVLEEISLEDPVTFRPERTADLLANIKAKGYQVYPTTTLDACSHEPDNRFLECAVAARADYIVTVNTRHFPSSYQGIETVLPFQFYSLL